MLRGLGRLMAAGVLTLGLGASTAMLTAKSAAADVMADILSRGTVRVGVFADVPPFGSPNAARELEGFDIDMANMVAKSLGVKLELVPTTAANRIPYLITDRVDINIALMSVTPERAKQIMFTHPYVNTALAVYGPKRIAVTSADTLAAFKVAAAKGTTEELELTALNPKANILRMEDNATAVQAYLSGQSDLWAGNSLISIELAKKTRPGVRPQVRHPQRAGPHGREDGRAQPLAVAEHLRVLEHAQRQSGEAAPEVAGHPDGPAAAAVGAIGSASLETGLRPSSG